MGYEIPQELEYKEKIMFNLTFKQLAYLFAFAPLMIIVFFKTPWNFTIRFILTAILSCFVIGFMFLNLGERLKAWTSWLKFRNIKEKSKLIKFSGIKEIKDDLIITNDNRKLAVLKIEPINFSIKPQGAQEAIIGSFQKFLNSLDFPIQIIMNTESLNLKDYLREISTKLMNNQFQELFKKYKEHLEKTISQKNVLNRNFYLIIPQKNDINIQIQLCQKKLDNMGLKSLRVENKALNALASKFFESLDNKLYPSIVENQPSYIKVNGKYNKILYANGYPRSVEQGFLDKIVSLLGDFDLSLHIEPHDIETMIVNINRELQKQRADLYASQLKGIINPSLEIKYADTRAILENLQKGKEKLFNVSLYINCRADTKEALDLISRRVESELNSLLIIPKNPQFLMAQGLQSCSPLVQNKLGIKRSVPTEALSAFFPFTSSFLQADISGIWLGLNKNNIPIIKDIFKLSNPNGLCLASSGSGKSYMAKLYIARHLLHGTKVMVIDPQGEYTNLVTRFNGQRVDLSRTSDTIINPMDLMGHDYQEKRLALMDLMPVMLGALTEPQKSFLDKAITEAYNLAGINEDPETWDYQPPLLEDVLNILKSYEKKAAKVEESTIRSLINRLDMYVNGVFSFLNRKTNINFNNRFVCFDVGNLPKQVKPTMMFLVLDYVYMKMKKDLERKILVIDEAWSLLSRTEDASYIFEIVKTCRKFNLALFLINQEVEGMMNSEAGKSILANSSYTLLMRQKPAVIENIQGVFHLSTAERTFLLTASVGEGILLMDDEHSEIKIVASEEEHKQITTNADEILAQNGKQNDRIIKQNKSNEPVKNVVVRALAKQHSGLKVRVDPDKRFFRHKELSIYDLKYLLAKGYKQIKALNIQGKSERYLIKPRRLESDSHFFMVYDIANCLKQYTDKINLYESVRPDIIFEVDNKKYAVEIETGKVLKKDKKKFLNKVRNLKKEFGDNWFFVVTDKNLLKEYRKFGLTFEKRNISAKLANLSVKGNFCPQENQKKSLISGSSIVYKSKVITPICPSTNKYISQARSPAGSLAFCKKNNTQLNHRRRAPCILPATNKKVKMQVRVKQKMNAQLNSNRRYKYGKTNKAKK